ncbi:MAG: hypothetical protein HN580_13100 [Deltaproteobacteria bacterium]|jgi:hypothetical protein|nr:hypothetical protein [Deltaproteobacteria bacterium]MBT4087202.1 hypothetical protein [Deltaproteobacteria bacterium]MBT7889953.1 hypothetical protein [Deltaproteobacteria bacterium]
MKLGIILLGLICLTFVNIPSIRAVDLIIKDTRGVYRFNCVNSCGPVRVRKCGKCEFLVQSTYFNGKVKACRAELAALKACGERKFDQPINKNLLNPACL